MFLRDTQSGDLVEVLDPREMFNPASNTMKVCYQAGEEVGEPTDVEKANLEFPSGEALPKCWMDTHYRVKF